MNFLNKITGNDKKEEPQGQGQGHVMTEAQRALQAALALKYNPEWTTRMGQCDPPATGNHWAFSCFCFPCAMATAKSTMDGTHPCYNFLCWPLPMGANAWLRKGYRIRGTCGDDLMHGIFCLPCVVRRAYTESELRTEIPLLRGGPDRWQTTLFACGCCEFFEALLCPFCVAHYTRNMIQPRERGDCCFDMMCIIPTAMYGQVRHRYNIVAEFDCCEDLFLPAVCYPCAIAQARREAQVQLHQQSRQQQHQGGSNGRAGCCCC